MRHPRSGQHRLIRSAPSRPADVTVAQNDLSPSCATGPGPVAHPVSRSMTSPSPSVTMAKPCHILYKLSAGHRVDHRDLGRWQLMTCSGRGFEQGGKPSSFTLLFHRAGQPTPASKKWRVVGAPSPLAHVPSFTGRQCDLTLGRPSRSRRAHMPLFPPQSARPWAAASSLHLSMELTLICV